MSKQLYTARQYKPFNYSFKNIPLIVYPVKDENPLNEVFSNTDTNSINKHLDDLYDGHSKILDTGNYHILFVWNLEGNRMVDVWIHNMSNWSNSGPLLSVFTFRNLEICDDAGIASGDSIITLAREEELRRKIGNIDEYVDRNKYMPTFPDGMQPIESFYEKSV